MRKLLAPALEIIAVFLLNGILNGAGDGIVDTQDGTLHEFDLPGSVALETGASRLVLALPKGFRRAGIASRIRRRCPVDAEGC